MKICYYFDLLTMLVAKTILNLALFVTFFRARFLWHPVYLRQLFLSRRLCISFCCCFYYTYFSAFRPQLHLLKRLCNTCRSLRQFNMVLCAQIWATRFSVNRDAHFSAEFCIQCSFYCCTMISILIAIHFLFAFACFGNGETRKRDLFFCCKFGFNDSLMHIVKVNKQKQVRMC